MPPGHLNAIFLKDVSALDTETWQEALAEANNQGGFVFWNHPGWKGQQPDGIARWYPEHSSLVEQGMLHGIEVVNSREYYPEAHRWCLEKNLTMLSNSDIHNPLNLDYHVHSGDHRPITLVFAQDHSEDSIREALFDRRTAVYSGNQLIGQERFLTAIFRESLQVLNPSIEVKGTGSAYLRIHNRSDITYELILDDTFEEIELAESLVLEGGKTNLLQIEGTSTVRTGALDIEADYIVENLLIGPNEGMPVKLRFRVRFIPDPQH
jgi:hypothetical protein